MIERYEYWGYDGMVVVREGDWVEYEDHVNEVEEVRSLVFTIELLKEIRVSRVVPYTSYDPGSLTHGC